MTKRELLHAEGDICIARNSLRSDDVKNAAGLVGAQASLGRIVLMLSELCDRIDTFLDDNKSDELIEVIDSKTIEERL